jgi:hypothetical protein
LSITRGQTTVSYGASESTIIQKFGTPIKNQPYFLEIKEIQGKELIYSDFEFLLVENKVYDFTLKTSNASLIFNGNSIKIGDPITALANFFPNYQQFPCGNDGYCINLLINGLFDEGFVLTVEFNLSTNKITKIYTHES